MPRFTAQLPTINNAAARQRYERILARTPAKSAGMAQVLPTEWQPGRAARNPRDLIVAGIHEELFMGRFCDFYIGGEK